MLTFSHIFSHLRPSSPKVPLLSSAVAGGPALDADAPSFSVFAILRCARSEAVLVARDVGPGLPSGATATLVALGRDGLGGGGDAAPRLPPQFEHGVDVLTGR